MINKVYIINTEDELNAKLSELETYASFWVFRGEADQNWELKTSIDRASEKIPRLPFSELESIWQINKTRRIYPEIKDINPTDYLEILSFLQHHGVPTRLLDFTRSPYLALYFSFEDLDQKSEYTTIYGFNAAFFRSKFYECIKKQEDHFTKEIDYNFYKEDLINWGNIEYFPRLYNEIINPDNIDFVLPVEPDVFNQRIFVQQGLFFLQGSTQKSFYQNLEIYQESDLDKNTFKLNINRNLQNKIILKLAKMGITPYSLYPGIEGLLKDMKLTLYRDYYQIFGI
ncbi:FRG domain-containing protein [Leptospira kanakyensis]|uniref:FRG domain-containing protein n=1 Tax=Leptospira kanakyensis TaxID=2484968 RepID=A0A6N4PXI9_9LEPT|nr:FRG domain-containing protein [Leptospira kanakyensis]TGK51149.1 FRG domain-containing protein [Leptospira kanakyensis]TGK56375.1 FRG domain-containing protein [Leptospira kanakyensis]TGK65693.1 FRG domain-containing protein [Leptospira kanakyensis]